MTTTALPWLLINLLIHVTFYITDSDWFDVTTKQKNSLDNRKETISYSDHLHSHENMEFPTWTNHIVCRIEVMCLSNVLFRDGSKFEHQIDVRSTVCLSVPYYHNTIALIADWEHCLFSVTPNKISNNFTFTYSLPHPGYWWFGSRILQCYSVLLIQQANSFIVQEDFNEVSEKA